MRRHRRIQKAFRVGKHICQGIGAIAVFSVVGYIGNIENGAQLKQGIIAVMISTGIAALSFTIHQMLAVLAEYELYRYRNRRRNI